jgi:hypothetical protein
MLPNVQELWTIVWASMLTWCVCVFMPQKVTIVPAQHTETELCRLNERVEAEWQRLDERMNKLETEMLKFFEK